MSFDRIGEEEDLINEFKFISTLLHYTLATRINYNLISTIIAFASLLKKMIRQLSEK